MCIKIFLMGSLLAHPHEPPNLDDNSIPFLLSGKGDPTSLPALIPT
jgi:hypothetical protein